MEIENINPAFEDLEKLVGQWQMVLSNATFLPDPTSTVNGTASFEWCEGGDFLIMRQGAKAGTAPWATWLIGRDQDSAIYTVLYIDNRRVSRVYQMSFEGGAWKIWRHSEGFSQRYVAKISDDWETISGSWETSGNGTDWEHDFDISYSRSRQRAY